ncbi:MAG: hypothetical protein ACK2UK_17605 [Candidatus Promineifilaceae bacterium]
MASDKGRLLLRSLLSLLAGLLFQQMVVYAQVRSVQDLWIDLRLGPPLIPVFNDIAQEDDIARIDHASQIVQLRGIPAGRKMVIFRSLTEAKQQLPDIASEIDIVGYNLEHNPSTPEQEQVDPVGSLRRMRALVDEYGLELAFGPDHDFALSHGVEAAPFVDIFVLQIQRQQTNPVVVEDFVAPLVPQLRQANPDLEVSVQVRTEGNVGEIIDLLDSLKQDLDGVSILTSPDTIDVAEELVAGLRASPTLFSLDAKQPTTYVVLGLLALGLLATALIIHRR